jgi:peroxiredoxin
MAIAPGNKAPDFAGTTPEGKLVSLHDLAGKVVYIVYGQHGADLVAKRFPMRRSCKKNLPATARLRL